MEGEMMNTVNDTMNATSNPTTNAVHSKPWLARLDADRSWQRCSGSGAYPAHALSPSH